MLHTVFAYLLLIVFIAAALPGATWLVSRGTQHNDLLVLTLTPALTTGVISLVMLIEGLLGIPFTIFGIALPTLIIFGIGAWRCWHDRVPLPRLHLPAHPLERLALALLVFVGLAILFNGFYWPFHSDDALGIYQPQAQAMYQSAALIPLTGEDSLYRAYPMLAQANYTFAYLASGWENEYLAKGVSTLLALGCLPVAYQLGAVLGGRRAGWLAALLLAMTPAFGRWASSGYVDLPMAYFYGLSALFALRLASGNKAADAVLAGAMLGLATWTKNAALLGIPLLGVWLLYLLFMRRTTLRHVLLAIFACSVIAAPWYVRNLLGAGFLVPATAWTDQAERTIANLLVFVAHPENYALTGVVLMLGISYGVWLSVRGSGIAREAARLLLLFSIPFFAAWWWLVSYDPRFLLLFLPLLCALGGATLGALYNRLPTSSGMTVLRIAVFIAVLSIGYVTFISVEYKDELARAPFMSDAEKRELVGGNE